MKCIMNCLWKKAAILILLAVLTLAGCNTDIISVTGISLNLESTSIVVGDVSLLTATIAPAEATNTDVSWSSSDETIVVVSESGIVIGMAAGTATITATTDDGEFTAICEVSVDIVSVSGISVNPSNIAIDAGKTRQLTVIINPGSATNHEVTWESVNPEIASVNDSGLVTGHWAGNTRVVVTTTDSGHMGESIITVGWTPTTGSVDSYQKISDIEGSFLGTLANGDYFGWSVSSPGDLNDDVRADLIVGAYGDDDGGDQRGAVWVLFMNSDGTVSSYQKISALEGGFSGTLADGDWFGFSVTSPGDLNGDGKADLVVGAPYDDDGGPNRGAVWVLFMNSDGTVSSHQKISDLVGGFSGTLADVDLFGASVTSPGDLNGDGRADLVVGTPYDDDGGPDRGAVWVLFMNSDGTVSSYQKISDLEGSFSGTLADGDSFGASVTSPGDLNEDGRADLVVGTPYDDDGGFDRGAVWVLFMNSDGTVSSHQKISDLEGSFSGTLADGDYFGFSVTSPGDLNGDGKADFIAGANRDDDGGTWRGAVWVLFMNSDGTVSTYQKISDTEGGFTGTLGDSNFFGTSVISPGDLNSDGRADLIVGANRDDDGGTDRGAVWVLFMDEE